MGKLKKEKHNHKLTDFLKVGIFSLVMLAPFISIGSKMAYVTFNKNAKDSYYGENINETTYTYIDSFNSNEYIYFNKPSNVNIDLTTTYIKCQFIEFDTSRSDINSWWQINKDNFGGFQIIERNNYYFIYFYDLQDTYLSDQYWGFDNNSFYIYCYTANSGTMTNSNFFYKENHNKYSYLDNVFEYAVNQLGETQIFAWTKNTAIYTPIETMTNGLGFYPDNNTLAILLTYWSLVTAVYVIMDIILFAFTKITHFTQD